MPGNYTAREVATAARQWGFYVDEGRGGPGHVGLVWRKRLIATMRHPLRPARGFTSPVILKKLASTVGVNNIDDFMAGPIKAKPSPLEVEPPPPRKEQPAMATNPAGYVPPSTRPRLQQEVRGLTRVVEQVLCVVDKPVTPEELYPEVVKHVPYATVAAVKQALENAAYVNRIRSEGREPSKNSASTSIVRVSSGHGSRRLGSGATFAIEPPQFFPADEIESLPDWRPREYVPRGKNRTKKKSAARKPVVTPEARERIVERRQQTAAQVQESAAQHQNNGQTPPIFEALFRSLDDAEVLILRDDQGNWWEARRVPGLPQGK